MKNFNLYKFIALVLVTALTFVSTGCTSQNDIAALTTILGNASASIAVIEGNTSLATQLKADTAAASAAVLAWKSGTPTTEVIEALNIVQQDLNLIPDTSQYAALVDLAIGTVTSILELLPSAPTPATPVAAVAHTLSVTSVAPHTSRVVHLTNAPKTAAQFTKQWNAIAVGSLAGAAIK